MGTKIVSSVLSPVDFFETADLGLPQTVVVVILVGLLLPLPNYLVGTIRQWGPVVSILFWAVLGIATALLLWAVLSIFVYGFIRSQSGYGIIRVASYVGFTAIPWIVLGVIQTLVILGLIYRGASTDPSALTDQIGIFAPILMSLTVLWQARLLLPAVRVGGGVDIDRARGAVTIFTLVGLAWVWATFLT